MDSIVLVCGSWIFDKNRWLFYVDKSKGCKVIEVSQETQFDDFLGMVFEDFGLNRLEHDVKLTYMFSSDMLKKLPEDTPPVIVGSSRQLIGFLKQFQKETMRLCVEIFEKDQRSQPQPKDESIEGGFDVHEIPEDDDCRFDYCEDPDGASSGDEDYKTINPKNEDDEGDCKNLPPKKRDFSNTHEYLELERSSFQLSIGQSYNSKSDFESRLKILSVTHQFDFDVVLSTRKVLSVKCWIKGCQWRVRASTVGENPCFIVKSYVEQHTCSITERSTRCRQATPDILGRLYKEFVGGVGPSVLPIHVADTLNKRYGLKIKYWKAHRSLQRARKLVVGNSESTYDELPSYLYMIKRANPGTFVKLEVDEEDRFKFLFLAFDASIQGFPYMKKVVVVDGTFLHGKYKGTLLTATMQDGNFNIFPIAFAVVDTENDESWEWFFTQLNRVIPDDEELAIISDRHGSIAKAILKVYPLSSRGICTYHLRKNILTKYKGGDAFRLVKKAASAYRLREFNALFDQIKALNPALHGYLQKADVRLWSRVHFPGNRYNITTTNIAESINHVLSEARNYPIVPLLDAIRCMLTRWFAKRRKNASLMATTLTTGVEKLLKTYFRFISKQSRVEDAKKYTVQEIDHHETEVTTLTTSHVVNLTMRKCSCKRFDLDKIPCVHAIAAAEASTQSRISLTHMYYHTSYLYNAYSKSVMPRDVAQPVPDEVAKKVCRPPAVRQQPGRPKNSRIKSTFEVVMEKKE